MTPDDFNQTAIAFAKMDLAQARPATADDARRLVDEYAAMLAAPTEAGQRVRLVATQLVLGVKPKATLYQLRRASAAGTDTASRARIGYLKGVAYSRIGDTTRATGEFENAARLDSSAVNSLIHQYRLESPAYRAVLRKRIYVKPVPRDPAVRGSARRP